MKRKFSNIRNKILIVLKKKELTRMEIAREIDADYRTVEKHLIWLYGTDKIKRIKRNKKTYYGLA